MPSITRDGRGRLVVRPKSWSALAVKRSRERAERIAWARQSRRQWAATTQWMGTIDRQGIAALEASGIAWSAVERWIDELEGRDASVARMVVKQVLQTLADDKVPQRERIEARNRLYRPLIAAGIME